MTDVANGVMTNVALPTGAQMQLKDAIEDNVDMEVSIDTPATIMSPVTESVVAENPDGWAAALGDGWADEESRNAWAQSGSWGDEAQEGQGTTGEAATDTKWADSNPTWSCDAASLFSLLGPSAFPLTHTTGIVECSTRRVSAIHFPPNHPKGVPSQDNLRRAQTGGHEGQDWVPSADGVEAELDTRFAEVILEPWGRREGDIAAPEIWNTSRGAVIDPSNPSKILGDTAGTATRKPHNPLKDSITLLVKPSFAETLELVPGLGLGAMWIEIIRQTSDAKADAADGAAEVDGSTPGKFWYHEDVTGIFPSFYTPREKEN